MLDEVVILFSEDGEPYGFFQGLSYLDVCLVSTLSPGRDVPLGCSFLLCLLTLLQFSCNLSGGKPTLSSELVITVNSQNLEQNYQLVSFPDIKHAEDSKDEMTGNQDTVASCHMPASVQGGSLSSPPMTHVDCSAPSISGSSVGKPTGARIQGWIRERDEVHTIVAETRTIRHKHIVFSNFGDVFCLTARYLVEEFPKAALLQDLSSFINKKMYFFVSSKLQLGRNHSIFTR
ncbi:hypothetical protein LWI29_009139 [Acer saccharum]|uniref:Uncharacterized protein n=1 Tax=Acer saccharum TaxID=4024 RepID=A0AA39VSJ6_ACESA|nr:hypothetical protein LWI29_009139 [Acer saccharum]